MWTCRSQIVQSFLLLNSKSLLVKWEWVVRHNHAQKHPKLSSALGTVTVLGLQRPHSPSHPSWWADASWSEWPPEVVKGVNKNTAGICEAVLSSQGADAAFCSETPRAWGSWAGLHLGHGRALLGSAGEQGGTEGPGNRNLSRGKVWKQPCGFCSYLFSKVWGCGYVRDKRKGRRREGTQAVHGVCCHQLPQHTCREQPTRALLSLVAAAASLSCGSWGNKGGVWIIPSIPAVPLVRLVRFVQRHKASPAWWLQRAFLFEGLVTGAQREGGL